MNYICSIESKEGDADMIFSGCIWNANADLGNISQLPLVPPYFGLEGCWKGRQWETSDLGQLLQQLLNCYVWSHQPTQTVQWLKGRTLERIVNSDILTFAGVCVIYRVFAAKWWCMEHKGQRFISCELRKKLTKPLLVFLATNWTDGYDCYCYVFSVLKPIFCDLNLTDCLFSLLG